MHSMRVLVLLEDFPRPQILESGHRKAFRAGEDYEGQAMQGRPCLDCVESAIFFMRSPPVIARAPAFIAFMATMMPEASADGLEITL